MIDKFFNWVNGGLFKRPITLKKILNWLWTVPVLIVFLCFALAFAFLIGGLDCREL